MTKFAAVGFTCIDIYKNINVQYPTGNGVDLMFNLIELIPALSASLVTAIGDDANGRSLLEACAARGVDCSHVSVHQGEETACVEMLLNGKDRVHHRVEKGVMSKFSLTSEAMDFIRAQDFIHTDFQWNVVDALADMKKNGTQIYFDFSKFHTNPNLEKVLAQIDYGIFSFEEETQQVRELLEMGCGLGAKALIATFGTKGSLAYDGSTFYREGIVPVTDLVNTVGAGDSYGSGFLSGIIQGEDIQACMRRGAKKSAEIVSIFEPYHSR